MPPVKKKVTFENETIDVQKEAIRSTYSQHMIDLGVIINNVEGSTLAQTQATIKTLAQGQEKILKLIKKVLT